MPHSVPSGKDSALLDLCARIMRDPSRLIQVTRLRIGAGFQLAPHAHNSLLQCDLAVNCGGLWIVNGRKCVPQSVSAIAFYPRQQHGYELSARRPDAEIYGFKLRIEAGWPAIRLRAFAAFAAHVAGEEPLIQALRRLARLNTAGNLHSPLAAVTLCEILCRWPGATPARAHTVIHGAAHDEQMEPAMTLIESDLAQSPNLSQLASAAHLSPRHFARRFRALYGRSPHTYIASRRAERAGELLSQGNLSVTAIAETLGFPSIHTFSRWFRQHTGATPTAFRQRPSIL